MNIDNSNTLNKKNYSIRGNNYSNPLADRNSIILNSIYSSIIENDSAYKDFGLELIEDKVFFDKKHIFTKIYYEEEQDKKEKDKINYKASYDSFIELSELSKIFIEINKRVLEYNIKIQEDNHCLVKIYVKARDYAEPFIKYRMSDDSFSGSMEFYHHLIYPLKEKEKRNRDDLIQRFNIGDNLEINNENIKIINLNYSIEDGFSYETLKKEKDCTVARSLDQYELLRKTNQTANIKNKLLQLINLNTYFISERDFSEVQYHNVVIKDSFSYLIEQTINSFYEYEEKSEKIFINRYEIDIFAKNVKTRTDDISRKIKHLILDIKESKKKLIENNISTREYEKIFSEKNYGIFDDKIKQIKLDIESNIKFYTKKIETDIINIKFYSKAKRRNIKVLNKIESILSFTKK